MFFLKIATVTLTLTLLTGNAKLWLVDEVTRAMTKGEHVCPLRGHNEPGNSMLKQRFYNAGMDAAI